MAIGTDKFLLIYFEGQLYDITPLGLTISALTFTFNGTTTITMTSSGVHGFLVGDIILFDSVTLPVGTGLSASDFEDSMIRFPGRRRRGGNNAGRGKDQQPAGAAAV